MGVYLRHFDFGRDVHIITSGIIIKNILGNVKACLKIFRKNLKKKLDFSRKSCIIVVVRQGRKSLTEGSEEMDGMNITEALLKAILELIEKCATLEELRESVKRIMNE